ncbi:carbohydrate-binding domain-containing protein [Raoultibacter phocaeensis]|uniref:carbohydrate-binding domain-containing protein n=1 Tax=Raoultibacter phocaeensis TaxID=2479841 RepID=UPI002105F336|nr:carbohydrate-binding domain-containing protein [Raoultibacter phocaeensis]
MAATTEAACAAETAHGVRSAPTRRSVGSFALSIGLAAALCLPACSMSAESPTGEAGSSGTSSTTASATSTAATTTGADVVSSANVAGMDFEYTDRDKDASFDETTATRIGLSQEGSTVDGSGAVADGSTVTIAEEGTYIVSGELSDGQLVVETADTVKVQIVLDGVTIHNEEGPALYVKQTDKCFITLADGSVNTLSDGANYVLEDGSDEPYATLFSKSDVTINGTGALAVTSSYRHAICSKDDLVITGGAFTVQAVEDGLRGRDCVKILDGTFSVVAGGDCIKSNKDTDEVRGFVTIDGGTFDLSAGDDGIQAVTYLRVAGGTLSIEATDDAIHSDLDALISGGDLTIDAGDDAVHAETSLTIDGGTIDIRSCFEGYEAEKLFINGGDTHIVADDDAINAAAAETPADKAAAEASGTGASDESAAQGPGGGMVPGGSFEQSGEEGSERMQNGGAPDNAFAEGGMTMGDENCLIEITGGYTVLEAGGDAVDSNGTVEISGGVLLVTGPTSSGDGAFDYDLSASVSGGTVLMVGSTGMAQNFTSGEQPFSFNTISGSAGESVAVTDEAGTVLVSYTSTKQFGMVLASSPLFEEGGTYQLVIGGTVADANADGYAESGTVSGGTSTSITASTTPTGGMGGGGMPAGTPGDVQRGMRG